LRNIPRPVPYRTIEHLKSRRRRIGRQEEWPRAAILNELCHTRSFVRGQIVHDNDIALRKSGSELRLDISLKSAAVQRTVEHPRCSQAVTSEAGNEGLGMPMAERHMHSQAFADGCPSPQPRFFHFATVFGLMPYRLERCLRLS